MASLSSPEIRKRRQTFGQARSLSQYAVSLPNQPDDVVSGVHPRDDTFKFFKKGRDFQSHRAKHHYTEDELRVLGTYESADNLPSHTAIYREWLEELPARKPFETWGIVAIIGVTIGFLAFLIKECCETLQIFRNPFVGDYIEKGETSRLWMYYAAISCSLACLSATVCVYLCPYAAGSGLPELIGILNGVVVRNVLSFRTMFYKILSCLLTVLSGLPVGFEGPMIHIGAMVAAALARPAHPHCRCGLRKNKVSGALDDNGAITQEDPKPILTPKKSNGCIDFCRYRDCKERHNLICMGAAAGVASAFSAPITGLLFAMEEMSSFWTTDLTWQTFVCCILSRSITEILRSIVSTLIHASPVGLRFSILELTESALFDTKEGARLNLIIIVPTICIGIFGGVLGSLFVFMHLKVARFRRRLLSKIKRVKVLNIIKVFEPIFVALVCSMIIMGSLPLFQCKPVDHNASIYSPHEGKFLRFHHYQCDKVLNLTLSNHEVRQTGEYNEFATLVFGSWDQMIRNLLSRKTAEIFSVQALSILFMFFFIFSSWGSLCFIASGLLIPQLAIGAIYGRLFGRLLCDVFDKVNITESETESWEWLDPGVFALLGSASFIAGVARLPVTSVVMLIEMTNDINLSLLIMIVVMIAKFVGGMFTHPLYHSMLEFRCIPYLEDDIKVYKDGRGINLELFKAGDIMVTPVCCVDVKESVQVLSNLLLDTNHGAFPVIRSGHGFNHTFLGMITRLELTILLTKTIQFTLEEITKEDIDRIRISYPEYSSSKLKDANSVNEILNNFADNASYENVKVNLLPYINTSAYSLPTHFSLLRTYMLFRTLGARHVVVVDIHNQVMGIITRKDLMGFVIEDKINNILNKRIGNGRIPSDFSPIVMPNGGSQQNNSPGRRTFIPMDRSLNEDDEEFDISDSLSPRSRPRERNEPYKPKILDQQASTNTIVVHSNKKYDDYDSLDGNV